MICVSTIQETTKHFSIYEKKGIREFGWPLFKLLVSRLGLFKSEQTETA